MIPAVIYYSDRVHLLISRHTISSPLFRAVRSFFLHVKRIQYVSPVLAIQRECSAFSYLLVDERIGMAMKGPLNIYSIYTILIRMFD